MSFPGLTCNCASTDCHLNGCKLLRGQLANFEGSRDEDIIEQIKHVLISEKTQVEGCICPPTSEMTCMSTHCPRRPSWDEKFRWVSSNDPATTYSISSGPDTKGE